MIKRATKHKVYRGRRTEDLVTNDLAMMERLSWARHFARSYHGDVHMDKDYMYLAVEKYDTNLSTYFANGQPKHYNISMFEIRRQLLDALTTLETENIIHGDLRLENIYLHKLRGNIADPMLNSQLH